jgi:hypothetical protein
MQPTAAKELLDGRNDFFGILLCKIPKKIIPTIHPLFFRQRSCRFMVFT